MRFERMTFRPPLPRRGADGSSRLVHERLLAAHAVSRFLTGPWKNLDRGRPAGYDKNSLSEGA